MNARTDNHRPLSFVGLLLSIAVLGAFVGGCARDDYYCDATGCYYCDGVGCRRVDPPTRSNCTGDYQCLASQACTDRGCATRCSTDAQCARGWVCRTSGAADAGAPAADAGANSGICVAPGEVITPTPGACRSNADCSNGTACLNGVCTRTTVPSCSNDSQCTAGQVCVSGQCQDPTSTCQFNNQCGPGRLCVNNACRNACGTDSPCPTGQECNAGICRDRVDGCTTDATCAAGQRCLNGTCYQSCTPGSSSCGSADLYCSDEGLCVPDTRPRPFCDATRPCQAGSECVGGICRVPCNEAPECQRVDVSYRACGPIPSMSGSRNYCLTGNESRPICSRQSECSMGQSCVDGACQ